MNRCLVGKQMMISHCCETKYKMLTFFMLLLGNVLHYQIYFVWRYSKKATNKFPLQKKKYEKSLYATSCVDAYKAQGNTYRRLIMTIKRIRDPLVDFI